MKTVIMAGGKGTRIAQIAGDIPKPMIPVHGRPVLEWQIDCLRRNGLTDIILVIGHLGRHIRDHFGDGRGFGCGISYFEETVPLGTAGALRMIEGLSDDFVLLNGDVIFDIDFSRMIAFHREKRALATLAAHPNDHPFDSALLSCDRDDRVTGWLNKEDPRDSWHGNLVNAGLHILSPELVADMPAGEGKVDLDRDMLKPGICGERIFAYRTPEYIKDMGTPERHAVVGADIGSGLVAERNLSQRQRAVFLDRDGTINIANGFVRTPDDFELLDGAAEAIRTINRLGFIVIVVTNQPVIARGEASAETLDLIHKKMETELGRYGAYVDDLFYCPHHPDKGFPGERPEYKIECDCRKPKPGLLLMAAEKYNIDLSRSYMVGDDERDVRAGLNAECVPVFLSGDAKPSILGVETFADLRDFAARLAAEPRGGGV